MNRLTSGRRWGLATALLAMPVWAAAQPVGVTPQRPVNPAQPPRDRPPPTQRVGTAVLKGRVVDGVTERARAARARPLARSRRVEAARPDRCRGRIRADGAAVWPLLASGREIHLSRRAIPRRRPVHSRQIDAAPPARRTSRRELHDSHLSRGRDLRPRVRRARRSRRHGPGPGAAGYHAADVRRWRDRCSRTISESFGFRGCNRAVYHPGPAADDPRTSFRRTRRSSNCRWPQPLPTYYPSALALSQAQPITVEPRRDDHRNRPDARRGNADARHRHGSTK